MAPRESKMSKIVNRVAHYVQTMHFDDRKPAHTRFFRVKIARVFVLLHLDAHFSRHFEKKWRMHARLHVVVVLINTYERF